jgi:hypothetical protein
MTPGIVPSDAGKCERGAFRQHDIRERSWKFMQSCGLGLQCLLYPHLVTHTLNRLKYCTKEKYIALLTTGENRSGWFVKIGGLFLQFQDKWPLYGSETPPETVIDIFLSSQ